MSDQMTVRVKFTDWNTYDNATRSFINFFMKEARLYVSTHNGKIYLSQADFYGNGTNYYYDATIQCGDSNVLDLSCTTEMRISCKTWDGTVINNALVFPVELVPYMNSEIVNDSDYEVTTSQFVTFNSNNLLCKYSLRSNNFGCSLLDNSTVQGLFYKIGILPFANRLTLSYEATSSISSLSDAMYYARNSNELSIHVWNDGCSDEAHVELSSFLNGYNYNNIIPCRMHSPVYSGSYIYGVAYAELYSSTTGQPVVDSIGGLVSVQCVDDNGNYADAVNSSYGNKIILSLTTDHLDDNALIPSSQGNL